MVIGLLVRLHQRPANARDLRRHQPLAQFFAGLRQIEQTLAPVALAFLLINITFADQFLQHPAQALLGNPQDVEQLRHSHAGVAAYEMHHPVVGPAEAKFAKDFIGIGNKIPVGKEQQFD